ncbi:MAG: hypothetical protein V3G42_00580 [Oscillospiraceae bacterium]
MEQAILKDVSMEDAFQAFLDIRNMAQENGTQNMTFDEINQEISLARQENDIKIQNIWFEFDEWADGYDEIDENSDVCFELEDGSKWCASFLTYQNLLSLAKKNQQTGELLSGQYFYADKPIFIAKMEKRLIISILHDIIQHEPDLSSVFTKIDD